MEGALVTIQAKAIVEDDQVVAVHLFGVNSLHRDTIHDIAQEAVDSSYGSVSHQRVAVFTDDEWVTMKTEEPRSITVRVHTY